MTDYITASEFLRVAGRFRGRPMTIRAAGRLLSALDPEEREPMARALDRSDDARAACFAGVLRRLDSGDGTGNDWVDSMVALLELGDMAPGMLERA